MTKTFEIYFNDLNKKAQEEYLKFEGVLSESDLNADMLPIAIIEVED